MSVEETDRAAAENAVAPRVSLDDIRAKIAYEYWIDGAQAFEDANGPYGQTYEEFPRESLSLLTLYVCVMSNGFMVVGKSAPASPENYNAELGKKNAYEDCIRQLWQLEGYFLRERLSEADLESE